MIKYFRSPIEINALQTGNLYIVSIPVGESIYIDDILQTGTTPVTIVGLLAGSHTYKLTLSGYQDVTGSFSIIAGQTTNILVINKDSLTLDGTQTYDYINIANGGKLYVTAYNGTGTTGRLILNVTDISIDSTSGIIGTARGYRGGAGGSTSCGGGTGCGGIGGEIAGNGGGNNGGSGTFFHSGDGAGGGGYGTIGGIGGKGSGSQAGSNATGGIVKGTLDGYDIEMGSGGGGGGGSPQNAGSTGNPGGAMLTINAVNVSIHGTVNFNGGNGGNGGYYGGAWGGGGGGGASGGGILIDATNVNITNAVIIANGGGGGSYGGTTGYGSGGDTGGGGRIKIFYSGTLTDTGATISAGTVFIPTPICIVPVCNLIVT